MDARLEDFAGFDMVVTPCPVRSRVRHHRPSGPERAHSPARLARRDRIEIRYRRPTSAVVYLVLVSDDRLTACFDGEPLPPPGRGEDVQEVEIVLGPQPAIERPVLVAAFEPIEGFADRLEEVNAATVAGPDERLERLVSVLNEQCSSGVVVLEGGGFRHDEAQEPAVPPELQPVYTALEAAEWEKAEALLRALDLAGSPDRALAAESAFLLGRALRRQGRLQEALEALERAEQVANEADTGEIAAMAAREAGRALLDAGSHDRALACFSRALAFHEKSGDRVEAAREHLSIGWGLYRQERYTEAREAYSKVLHPARQAGEKVLLAAALEAIGQLEHELGRFENARARFGEALEAYRELADERGQMKVFGDLGLLELELGRYEKAVPYFRQQRERVRRVGSPQEVGISALSLGAALAGGRQYDEARDLLDRALETLPAEPPAYRDQARVVAGELELNRGNLEEAARLLQLDAPLSRDLALETLRRAALARGRLREALELPGAEAEYRTGVEAVERVRTGLPRLLRTEFSRFSLALYERWITQMVQRAAPGLELLDAMERARARAFLEALVASDPAADPAGMDDAPPSSTDPATDPVLDAEALCNRLPADTCFLVTHTLPDHLVLLKVHDANVDWRALPVARATLIEKIQAARACLRTPPGEDTADSRSFDHLRPLVDLSDLLLDPIQDWLEVLSPGTPLGWVLQGPLHGLPIHALPRPDARHLPGDALIGTHPIFYLPSLQAGVRWVSRPSSTQALVAALANPHGDLPHAEAEAREMVALLKGTELRIGAGATVRVLETLAPRARYLHLGVHGSRGAPGRPATLTLAPTPPRRKEEQAQDGPREDARNVRYATGEATIDAYRIMRLRLSAELVTLSACESGGGPLADTGEGPHILSWAFLAAGARAVVATGWRVDDAASARLMSWFYRELSQGRPRALALAMAQRKMFAGDEPTPASPRETRTVGVPSSPSGEAERDHHQGEPCPDEGAAPSRRARHTHPYYWAGFFLSGDWR